MNFLEQFLLISPDGGSGATESAYLAVTLTVALGILFRRRLRRLTGRPVPPGDSN
jgi:hypothetical protein